MRRLPDALPGEAPVVAVLLADLQEAGAAEGGVRPGPVAATVVPLLSVAGELVAATETALRDASRLDTWQAQAALDLARRIEASPHATLSQAATAHRELRAAVAEGVKGSHHPRSVVQARRDELAAPRVKKRAEES